MIIQEEKKKLAPQVCPLCGELQDIYVAGWESLPEDRTKVMVFEDKGYSFCNCRNIYFTDWSNINQGKYDEDYYKKYDSNNVNRCYRFTVGKYLSYILSNLPVTPFPPSVLDVGAINPTVLDVFKREGFKTFGLDICNHPLGEHELIVSDFEKVDSDSISFDVIWASHVFEHFKDPIGAIKKANSLLFDGGLLVVKMPDPWFIDYSNPHAWGHWHVREHHILWDMDSFAQVLEENGFNVIEKIRNANNAEICILDFTVIAKKVKNANNNN